MNNTEWILCPICGNKTRIKIRTDTELKNFLLFCHKCKQETLINAQEINIVKKQSKEADQIMQSQ